jgi:UDP-glucose:(glucosyl)LPS alpha-1,2-glucosyltransferase
MAEIRDGKFIRNETNQNSFGGTERMTSELAERINPQLLNEFQIVSSRVRDLQEDKIRIFWAHDLPGDPESDFLKDKTQQANFHKFVFVSNWQMQGYMQTYGIPWSKCTVLRNAIVPIEKHNKPNVKDGLRFIYTSTPHRGLAILVPVFEALAKKYDNIHLDVYSSFKIYGWEQRDEQFRELFDRVDLNPNMTHHGSRPNSEVREALKNSHVFAYPSIWAETSCLSLIEAMSAGLHCVHSNYAALPETSANWTTMYQLHEDPNKHAGAFYHILESVINNYEEKSEMRESTQSYTNIMYGWDWRIVEWEAFLNSLLINITDRSLPKPTFSYKS